MRLPASVLEALLAEDVPDTDLTTGALGFGAMPGRMSFTARSAMVVAGIEIAGDMLRLAGATVHVEAASGDHVDKGARLLTAEGPAAALHRGWKSAQTLVEILSGIAGAARAVVDAVEAVDANIRVACTRKTVPGARRLSMHAIRAGGAIPHRLGLSETVLVFEEHRAFLSGWPLSRIAERLRREVPEKKLVIEVHSTAEAAEAIAAGFDVVQLEKFTPDAVAEVTAIARAHPVLVAAAGGIHPDNAAAYVRAGAGLIVTSWPYTARPADVSVKIESAA
jgi:molybdenum transport protein